MSEPPPQPPLRPLPLHTTIVGSRILIFDEVDSTSSRAFNTGGDGVVVVAERQTKGRGRHGRPWHSSPGLGLWLSVAFEGPHEGLAFAAPLAVRDALRPLCEASVKWPNDLLLEGKKVCGLLLEHRDGLTVLGIGVNVHHRPEDFPPDMRETAASIESLTGVRPDRRALLTAVLTRLDERVIVIREGGVEGIRREWAAACALEGRRVCYGGVEGVVSAVDRHGGLVLDTPQGAMRVLFGERVEWCEA